MKVFLAGGNGKNQILSAMLIRERERECDRAGVADEDISGRSIPVWNEERTAQYSRGGMGSLPYILESFYYADADTERLIPYMRDFMLDSGAFTFMQNRSSHVNWDEYIERYADFIKRNKVGKFFELDIDSVVGYEKVIEYRRRLERLTGRQPIPVWHTNRGTKEFEKSAKEYPYVAIGGLVGTGKSEYARKYWKYFPWFIKTAHENGAKIHALGFTSEDGIRQFHFDSVDSTAWTTGNRFGFVYRFTGKGMVKIEAPKNKRLGDAKRAALHNFSEWVKFQKWADTHL